MIFYGKTLPVNLVFTYFLFTILSCSKNTTPTKSFDWNANTFTQNGYTLNWQTNDVNFDVGVKKQLVETFFTVYPRLAKDFNPNLSKTALFSTHIGYGIWGSLLKKYPTSTVVPFTLLIPVVGFLSSALFLNESLASWKLWASFFIMGGLLFNLFGKKLVKFLVNKKQSSNRI